MAKLPRRIGRVHTSCAIKGCTNVSDGMLLDRHHIRSEKLFVHKFVGRNSKRYAAFKRRYYAFREQDIIRVCRAHHEDLHRRYYGIIMDHCGRLHQGLSEFSWNQARIMMNDFARCCSHYCKAEEYRLKTGGPQMEIHANPFH